MFDHTEVGAQVGEKLATNTTSAIKWVLYILALIGFVFCVGSWACAMPQVWGTGVPFVDPIAHFAVFNIIITGVVGLVATCAVARHRIKRAWVLPVIWFGVSTAAFLSGKLVALHEEKTAMVLGESIIQARQPDGSLRQNRYSSRVTILGNPQTPTWSMSVHGRFVPWWEINYRPDRGWFYVQD